MVRSGTIGNTLGFTRFLGHLSVGVLVYVNDASKVAGLT